MGGKGDGVGMGVGGGAADCSSIPGTSSALIAVPSAVCLSAIILSFLTTSPPLAPVACPDHNSSAQGEKKKKRPLYKPLLCVDTHFRHVHVCGHVYEQVKVGHSASWVLFFRGVRGLRVVTGLGK